MFGIRAAAAFDGERAVPGGALVLLDGGHLAGVEPGAAPAPDGCEVLEVPGGTVLPGLVDAHVHLCADGTDGSLDRIQEPSEEGMPAVISQSLRTHGMLPLSVAALVAGGVTTVAALATATSLAAEACGLGDRKGWLRAGYDADLLIVDGDPVAEIAALSRPLAVFAGGRKLAGAA